jgi:hypothetical protein
MNDTVLTATIPALWLETLNESDADLAAGRIVRAETALRDLKESLARLEAKAAIRPVRMGMRQH